jgi:hypothetical protein
MSKDTEKISMVDQIGIAFGSPGSYNKLTGIKTGKTVVYVILLTLLLAFIKSGISSIVFVSHIGGFKHLIMDTIPAFTIEDGELNMEDKMELEIGNAIIYVDTSIDEISMNDVPASDKMYVAFGKKNSVVGIAYASYTYEYMNYQIGDLISGSLDNQSFCAVIPSFYMCIILMFIFSMIGVAVTLMFLALVFSVFGRGLANNLRTGLSYGNVLRICIYGLSVPMMLMAVNQVMDNLIPSPLMFIIVIGVALFYVGRGVASHAKVDIGNMGE